MHGLTKTNQSQVISYRTLRRLVGILGVALPFVLFFGAYASSGVGVQSSVSSYYHTEMRDIFVGTLCVIGFFLLSYRGHDSRDNIAGDIACLSVLVVAFVPTARDGIASGREVMFDAIHLAAAAIFFSVLIYFCLALFTKTHPDIPPTQRKLQRNRVYKICGITMAACIALIVIYKFVLLDRFEWLDNLRPVYWLEAVAITAFGISWLTKGRALLNEKAER